MLRVQGVKLRTLNSSVSAFLLVALHPPMFFLEFDCPVGCQFKLFLKVGRWHDTQCDDVYPSCLCVYHHFRVCVDWFVWAPCVSVSPPPSAHSLPPSPVDVLVFHVLCLPRHSLLPHVIVKVLLPVHVVCLSSPPSLDAWIPLHPSLKGRRGKHAPFFIMMNRVLLSFCWPAASLAGVSEHHHHVGAAGRIFESCYCRADGFWTSFHDYNISGVPCPVHVRCTPSTVLLSSHCGCTCALD